MRARTALAVCWALAAVPAAGADGWWIVAETSRAEGERSVAVRLHEGPPFAGSELPYRASSVARFQRLWRAGRAGLAGTEGRSPAARFRLEPDAVHLLALDSSDGSRFCKALIVAGAAPAGDPLRWSELGQTLEIVPQSDPVDLARAGGLLELQVLFDREPLAGAVVAAVAENDPAARREARTDEVGLARVRLDRPGRWWIGATHRGVCEGCADAGVRDYAASLVLAAGPVD